MRLKSKVGIAKTGVSSVRTTIPEEIVEYLNLKAGDTLEWSMEIIENTRVTFAKKVKRG